MKIINSFTQQSDEWFAYKLGKFSASDAQAIATNGEGLETLAFNKATERITGMATKKPYSNDAMGNGNELEELARNAVELEFDKLIKQVGLIEMNEYIVCSPDGLVDDDGMVEIKCPTNRVYAEYLYYKKIDPKYIAQMQMQMLVSERKWVDYVVFNPNFPKTFIIQRVERDEECIKKIEVGLSLGIVRVKEIMEKINGKE